MRVSPRSHLGDLLRRDLQVSEILGWYSVDVGRCDDAMTLAEVCKNYRLDVEDVITDLEAVLDDDDEDEDDDDDDGEFDDDDDDDEVNWEDEDED